MKFIHTADLHLGNRMHDIDREEEYVNFFKWLKERIVSEDADTLVIAGDVYDTANPPVDARKLYIRFLASLLDTNCKNIIVVGGNHDSGAYLDADNALLEVLNIHVVGSIATREIKDIVFKLYDKEDKVIGICAAVPYVREAELRHFSEQEKDDKSFGDKAFKALYDEALMEAKRIRGDLDIPIITTGHLYAANLEGRYEGQDHHESQDDGVRVIDVVGNLGVIHVDIFSNEYDYVALGHIHYPSRVAGKNGVRYSGSPFVMGFDETDVTHTVLSVECVNGRPAIVNKIPVPQTYKFARFKGNCESIKSQLEEYIKTVKDDEKAYLEARYALIDSTEVNRMLDNYEFPENVMVVSTKADKPKLISNLMTQSRTMKEMQELDPEEVFEALIRANLAVITGENTDSKKKTKTNSAQSAETNSVKSTETGTETSVVISPETSSEATAKQNEEHEKIVQEYLKHFLIAYDEVKNGGNANENN